ncbi:GNAT family N-acetyltransferase [Roseibium porphyridii]|uniref:GNAT family N-acetyltransferase n=2 Tax=Hyphomicrobiales TaxID=356 RepID=A0ABY8F063_9HYPH|nr:MULTISPECIES: GNAT family N-acetyltransferase [Stappiaceae]QFT33510.1 Acetyltransferase (GNAT) family protein [Labrenzia sp. THAF82]WFE88780.1 GNAT family N-acetyltransferase [Roseibium sp. KMA01]
MTKLAVIRAARKSDTNAVNSICLRTGNAGKDATSLYQDPDLIGLIYAAPYLFGDDALCLVAEDEEGVLGYVAGATDSRSFEHHLEMNWWPELRKRYAEPQGDPAKWTPDDKRINFIHHPRPVPGDIVLAYPAHIHMNLLPQAQGRGIGSQLLASWVASATEKGVRAVHAGVSAANQAGLNFWTARGFDPVREDPHGGSLGTIWCGRIL